MTVNKNKFDPAEDEAYRSALQQLEAARAAKPSYESKYGLQAQQLYTQLQNREPFTYNPQADPLYGQYRQQYLRQGRQAMEDTLGRAQSMTGGYANSYAQTAAQQTYGSYMSALGDKLPQLYAQALERYQQEGNALTARYQQAKTLEEEEYARHKDALDAYRKDVAALQQQADSAYDRSYQRYLLGYQQTGDSYSRLLYLMEKLGYRPTREELLAAGFTPAQADSLA